MLSFFPGQRLPGAPSDKQQKVPAVRIGCLCRMTSVESGSWMRGPNCFYDLLLNGVMSYAYIWNISTQYVWAWFIDRCLYCCPGGYSLPFHNHPISNPGPSSSPNTAPDCYFCARKSTWYLSPYPRTYPIINLLGTYGSPRIRKW